MWACLMFALRNHRKPPPLFRIQNLARIQREFQMNFNSRFQDKLRVCIEARFQSGIDQGMLHVHPIPRFSIEFQWHVHTIPRFSIEFQWHFRGEIRQAISVDWHPCMVFSQLISVNSSNLVYAANAVPDTSRVLSGMHPLVCVPDQILPTPRTGPRNRVKAADILFHIGCVCAMKLSSFAFQLLSVQQRL